MAAVVRRVGILLFLTPLLLGLLGPAAAQSQAVLWERDGLAGREVRVLVLNGDASGMVGLVGGAREPTPLWQRDARGWTQQTNGVPGFVLALAPLPEGGVLLGTGRDISDQPGVFWMGSGSPSMRRLYDAQAIGALAVAPGAGGASSEVYAATAPWADRDAPSMLLRSDAASGAWYEIHRGTLTCYEMPSYFKQIAVSPADPAVVVAVEWCLSPGARQTQLWRSDDSGQTWRLLPRRDGQETLVDTLALDPADSQLLYLVPASRRGQVATGLERSEDGGQTWTPLAAGEAGLPGMRTLLIDPQDPRRILAGTEQGGAFISPDRGESWQALPGLEGNRVWSFVLDEAGGTLYAATADGVWRMAVP